jgi:hypothetical protein
LADAGSVPYCRRAVEQIVYEQTPYLVTVYPEELQAYDTAHWQGWVQQPTGTGSVDNHWTYLDVRSKPAPRPLARRHHRRRGRRRHRRRGDRLAALASASRQTRSGGVAEGGVTHPHPVVQFVGWSRTTVDAGCAKSTGRGQGHAHESVLCLGRSLSALPRSDDVHRPRTDRQDHKLNVDRFRGAGYPQNNPERSGRRPDSRSCRFTGVTGHVRQGGVRRSLLLLA